MRLLTTFLVSLSAVSASFCGDSSIPYSFEVLPDGQPVLGCARPTCFGWAPSGLPASHTASFYRINRNPDGFLRKERASIPPFRQGDIHFYHPQTATCEESFGSYSCDQDDQWVGGIAPLLNVTESPTALQCCSFDPLRLSVDRGVADVHPGSIFVGGEAKDQKMDRQFAFDYISDVAKTVYSNGSVKYEVKIRRFPCLPLPTRRNFNRFALQAPTATVNDPFPLPQNNIEGPFSEDQMLQQTNQDSQVPVETTTVPNVTPPQMHRQPQQPYRPPQQPQAPAPYSENSLWPTPIDAYPTAPPPSYPVAQYNPVPSIAPQCCGPPQAPAYYNPGPAAPGAYYCFSGDTQVLLIDGSQRRMDKLKVDDWIQTIEDETMVYSPITLWLHRNPEKSAVFRKISLEDGKTLKITGKHYIFKTTCTAVPTVPVADVACEAVFAETVRVGDCLYTQKDETTMLKTKVVAVEEVRENGIYAPLTPNGKLMVNGILASCHSMVQSNTLQQSFFSYVDAFFSWSKLFFGNTISDVRELPMGMDLLMGLLEQVIPKNLVTM